MLGFELAGTARIHSNLYFASRSMGSDSSPQSCQQAPRENLLRTLFNSRFIESVLAVAGFTHRVNLELDVNVPTKHQKQLLLAQRLAQETVSASVKRIGLYYV
jgi:hypothetical protein